MPRRRRRQRRIPDSQQLAGIKQGVGRAVSRAFGSGQLRRRRRGGGMMPGPMNTFSPCLLDAFHFAHMTLPRPTGPYTVIRTTQLCDIEEPFVVLGPISSGAGDEGIKWTNIFAWAYKNKSSTASSPKQIRQYTFDAMHNSAWSAAQITPAAFSIQIMNQEAIQTSEGIIYAGRLRTAWKIYENRGKNGETVFNQFISYNNPRLMSAAKLAFRGVQVDAIPFNMSELSDFTVALDQSDGDTQITVPGFDFSGMSPIFVANPNKVKLQFLVCCEWRVRFDPSNPAQASHVQHTHTSENVWMSCLRHAEQVGNGVVDIADKIAQVGNAVYGASAGTYRAARGVRALTGGLGALALGA